MNHNLSFTFEISWPATVALIYFFSVGVLANVLIIFKVPEWWAELVQTFKDAKYKPVKDYDEVIKNLNKESK